jgi:excisionase family DNA binding protein
VTDKQALTTGEAAKYCGVNFRTVIRWIERGHLDAYKLPGRGDNRIPVDTFVDYSYFRYKIAVLVSWLQIFDVIIGMLFWQMILFSWGTLSPKINRLRY